MKNHIFLIGLFLFSFQIYSQELLMESELETPPDVSDAKFNGGGIEKFNLFIREQFNYSKVKKAGKMVAAFTIDKEGSIKNIKLIEFIDMDSATEMIRVLNACPKWEPAKRSGKPISIEIKYPMVFNYNLNTPKQTKRSIQDSVPPPISKTFNNQFNDSNGTIYSNAGIEKRPDFPGGMQEFYKYIATNYKTPNVAGLSGKVYVSFVVEKDGSLDDIKIIRDIGHGTAEEAIRVLSNSPKWIPGEQQGKKVRVLYSLPINITTPR